MRHNRRLIERYVTAAILPYLFLSLSVLTFMLLAQQSTRFAEILGSTRTPFNLTAEVLLELLPNILLFTLPMSVLFGTATGFSRLGSDSELVAMKAAGIGHVRIVTPVLLMGVLATLVTLYNGLMLAPEAAHLLYQSALRAALYKLESPVEPNTFNTDLPGKVIYVREGDATQGHWGRVFIYWQEDREPTRIVTARTGRIDSSGEQSELVLSDAMVTTLGTHDAENSDADQVVIERSAQLRVRLNTGREALLNKLESKPNEFDQMEWHELLMRSRSGAAETRRAALQALHKRLALCCAPLALALLGAGIGVRIRRGGRALGMLLSLASLLTYYLLQLGGEQLSRSGTLPPQVGAWLATGLSILIGALLLLVSGRSPFGQRQRIFQRQSRRARAVMSSRGRRRGQFAPLGLLDRSLLRALALNFTAALVMMICIFLIFTLFELLRYMDGNKWGLLIRYLFFLVPMAGTSIAPISMLVAVLITYALLARRSEAVAWWAAGQSVYRMALPCLFWAVSVAGGVWLCQEHILPEANHRQEVLRAQIRGGAAQLVTPIGRRWLALPTPLNIYTYIYNGGTETLEAPTVFEFDNEGVHIRRIVKGEQGVWPSPDQLEFESARVLELAQTSSTGWHQAGTIQLPEHTPHELFKPLLSKPLELNTSALSNYIKTLKLQRGVDVRSFEVALAQRWAAPLAPLVMALLGLPLALAVGRRTALAALSAAVAVGLAFWGSVSGFQQLSQHQLLPPPVAAWGPLLLFSAVGAYLLSRART